MEGVGKKEDTVRFIGEDLLIRGEKPFMRKILYRMFFLFWSE
jgi:hypothetical protein